ncbi:hypothetical protein Bbelb_235830 [Branchiostoma belcheri]|nr:hypothetical protein Bbelb_235830 [Branchiostoma belcheri]
MSDAMPEASLESRHRKQRGVLWRSGRLLDSESRDLDFHLSSSGDFGVAEPNSMSMQDPGDQVKIRAARLRLFGHIARTSPPLEPARLLLEPTPANWTRPRDRPRQKWLDVLTSAEQKRLVDCLPGRYTSRSKRT